MKKVCFIFLVIMIGLSFRFRQDDTLPYKKPVDREPTANILEQKNVSSLPKPKSAISDFDRKYLSQVTLQRVENGAPVALLGNFKPKGEIGEWESLKNLISDLAPVLEIDHPENLSRPARRPSAVGETIVLTQSFQGIPVQGGMISIHSNDAGEVFLVNNSFVNGVENVDTNPSFDGKVALQAAVSAAKQADPSGREPLFDEKVSLVIQEFESGKVDLAYKVNLTQPSLKPPATTSIYYVNAHDVALVQRVNTAQN